MQPAFAIVPSAATNIMVASGDAGFRKQMLELLSGTRHRAIEALGGADALLKLEVDACAGLVLDRRLPDLDAEEFAGMVSTQYPELEIQLLDSHALTLRRPVAQPAGLDFHGLMQALQAARPAMAARRDKAAEAEEERLPAPARPMLPGLVGRSAHLGDVSALVRLVAPRRTPVLVLGETGTGKELIAQALHQSSRRAQRPWVVVNCAAIPEALLESELFGYLRGAFTGAVQSRTGRILAAHTGTLFLDEVGELPLQLQSKLLRFLQEGELQRLGSNDPQQVDVRVVAATNVDLLAAVEAGRFRRDLYYRLAVFPIEVQPLRQRREDVLPLARYFLTRLAEENGAAPPRLTPEAAARLEAHDWPGNVRELQHSLERAYILAGEAEAVGLEHFPGLHPQAAAAAR